VGELGEQLGLDSGTLSPLLKRMEARELLMRTRSSADERVVTLNLTDRGRDLREELSEIPACLARETGLTAREAYKMLGMVRDLTSTMRRAPAAEVAG
jgi:DNA-binding MarR family transcriptional regulator